MSKVNDLPYFPFYPKDFANDGRVEAMSTEEVGAYILLLCKAWREEPVGSIPDCDRTLARWARLTPEKWSDCRSAVLLAFTKGTDGRWHQRRMTDEYEKLRTFYKTKQKAAKLGAQKRWGNHILNATGIRMALPEHSQGNAIEKPNIYTYPSGRVLPSNTSPPKRDLKTQPRLQVFLEAYKRKFGRDYVISNFAEAGGAARTTVTKVDDPTYAKAIEAYFASNEKRVVESGFPFSWFIRDLNIWVTKSGPKPERQSFVEAAMKFLPPELREEVPHDLEQ